MDELKYEGAAQRIVAIGVGGGGSNAIDTMIRSGLQNVDFIACNTDLQALDRSLASRKIQLGKTVAKGLGAGANPKAGKAAAMESQEEIKAALEGAAMVFVTAGMGGGTGTGAAPVVATLAHELGALTVGVVSKPFRFEGPVRTRNATSGIADMKVAVDTLITVPNYRLRELMPKDATIIASFQKADEVLLHAVQGIVDVVFKPGNINLDFADIRTVMGDKGYALMGIGVGHGSRGVFDAVEQAISSPLLDDATIRGAKQVLINLTVPLTAQLGDVDDAMEELHQAADADANIIFGQCFDPDPESDTVKATLIATGFPPREAARENEERKVPPIPNRGSESLTISNRIGSTGVRRVDEWSSVEPHGAAGFTIHPLAEVEGEVKESLPIDDTDYELPTFLRREGDPRRRG